MRLSEFRRAVAEEFGEAFGDSLLRDLVLDDLEDRTANQALALGVAPRKVWLALCRACDVPQDRRHGVGLENPR